MTEFGILSDYFRTTFGLLLEYFRVPKQVNDYFRTTFGLLLDYFWITFKLCRALPPSGVLGASDELRLLVTNHSLNLIW